MNMFLERFRRESKIIISGFIKNFGDKVFRSSALCDFLGLVIFSSQFSGERMVRKSWRVYTIASYHLAGNKGVTYMYIHDIFFMEVSLKVINVDKKFKHTPLLIT